ncbi:hypothetical protein J8L98_19530 [Pseudoalteromonas sp. MMG013]|uniref:hypothetical protein n=1 Tax=Pseudoalteromonas sp. MMG013 TaxID=2822687 RepID=UPI001B390E1D|nr:hypothetical protein [Pseudoalteromonas sp. MMG013]MBQ4863881.1 hypothetical protein [Pseudoalteromonas sp. MMG013]
MKLKALFLSLMTLTTFAATATNDLTGTVSEMNIRSDKLNNDHIIYFRLNAHSTHSTFAKCVAKGASIVWELDLKSPVFQQQYDLLMRSYSEQLPVRVIGQDNVCNTHDTSSDQVFELSPINWNDLLAKPENSIENDMTN